MAVPPRRTHIPGTYFVTSRTWESRKIFTRPTVCELFIEVLLCYRDQGSYLLHAFVLMPDHVHVLLTPGPTTTLERAVQFMKGGSSRSICQATHSRFPVWQRGYSDHRIRDLQDCESHMRYIAQNPVRWRLVQSAAEYPWSSACGRFPMDELPQGLKPLTPGVSFGTVETVP